ncbi:hypothetical protein DFH11DRAFT_1591151 [Phellopilus nigrolimitatus]|nr:hypothetical protein DFH11DRAFT_1591151 [Phellopilus nigrolimitatus]
MTHVLLLRTPEGGVSASGGGGVGDGKNGSKDPYEAQLAPATSVAVYETVQTLNELQWILETGPGFHGYCGVVVTSKRSVDAWAAAAKDVPAPVDERAHWTNVPFYVVGAATASAVRDLRTTLADATHLVPTEVLGAEEAGTGEKLAHFILEHLAQARAKEDASTSLSTSASTSDTYLNGSSPSIDKLVVSPEAAAWSRSRRGSRPRRPTKLLFLTGDKTRDALPTILTADGSVELDSVQVYAAKPAPGFATELQVAVKAQPKVKTWWITFFAPSSADYALPYLREHFTLPDSTQQKQKWRKKGPPAAKIAAIGPTTAAHVCDTLKLHVAAIAAKPGPEELAAAIKNAK